MRKSPVSASRATQKWLGWSPVKSGASPGFVQVGNTRRIGACFARKCPVQSTVCESNTNCGSCPISSGSAGNVPGVIEAPACGKEVS